MLGKCLNFFFQDFFALTMGQLDYQVIAFHQDFDKISSLHLDIRTLFECLYYSRSTMMICCKSLVICATLLSLAIVLMDISMRSLSELKI